MEKSTLETLIAQGLSSRDMAQKLTTSQTNIRYWLKKYGLDISIKKGPEFFCDKCGENDPTRFYRVRGRCKNCHNKGQIERFRECKRKAVEYKGGCCQVCGYNKCLAALDFHHQDPKQKDPHWRQMRNWKFDRLKEELDKCILVCSRCHAEIHYGD